jgi:hypothetical protein
MFVFEISQAVLAAPAKVRTKDTDRPREMFRLTMLSVPETYITSVINK